MRRLLIGLLSLTLVIAGCTGSSQHGTPSHPATASTAPERTRVLTFTDVDLTNLLVSAAGKAGLSSAPIDSLSCRANFCMVLAGPLAVPVTTTTTTSGATAVPIAGSSGLRLTVACSSARFCLAATLDGSGRYATWDGTTWSSHSGAPTTPTALTCPVAGYCAAIAEPGAPGAASIATYAGHHWHSATVQSAGHRLLTLGCSTSTYCVALATGGLALTDLGHGWSAPSILGSTSDHPTSLSCASGPYCLAVGNGAGYVSAGAAFAPADLPALAPLHAGSCGVANFCLVSHRGSTSPQILTGQSLANAPGADRVGAGSLLSCTSTLTCAAVTGVGDVLAIARAS